MKINIEEFIKKQNRILRFAFYCNYRVVVL